jgi:hypothetical protein
LFCCPRRFLALAGDAINVDDRGGDVGAEATGIVVDRAAHGAGDAKSPLHPRESRLLGGLGDLHHPSRRRGRDDIAAHLDRSVDRSHHEPFHTLIGNKQVAASAQQSQRNASLTAARGQDLKAFERLHVPVRRTADPIGGVRRQRMVAPNRAKGRQPVGRLSACHIASARRRLAR